VVIAEKGKIQSRSALRVPQGKSLIQVDSSLQAMQQLAKEWRRELGVKVVGITGSNGKTTTKDMVAAVLGQKYQVYKNKENQNNELGLPMTILNAPEGTEILILEMGMRGLGQIKSLCEIAEPDTGIITNIGTTHMELLGSQENIAQAKWELIEALPEDGVAILNAEDLWSVEKSKTNSHPAWFYGLKGTYHKPDLRGDHLVQEGTLGTRFEVVRETIAPQFCGDVRAFADLPLPGEHNVLDALAALTAGTLYEISLTDGCKGLGEMELSRMRLELHPGLYGSTLISDVYNANPTSMQASLKVLSERGGTSTLAILGEMYELGEASAEGHYAVGRTAAELGITELITVGPLADEIARGAREQGMADEAIHPCKTRDEAVERAKTVLARLEQGVWVLIKASRGMKMEEVTKELRKG
jgi:UDP-N-acetylmuramoyl-tripeptide--D-alanyl-D-alanine ligase